MRRVRQSVMAARDWTAKGWAALRERMREPPLSIRVMAVNEPVGYSWLHELRRSLGVTAGAQILRRHRRNDDSGDQRVVLSLGNHEASKASRMKMQQPERRPASRKAAKASDDGTLPADAPLFVEVDSGRTRTKAELWLRVWPRPVVLDEDTEKADAAPIEECLGDLRRSDALLIMLDPGLYLRDPGLFEALGVTYRRLLSDEPVAGSWNYVLRALEKLSPAERRKRSIVEACLRVELSLVFGDAGGLGIDGESLGSFYVGFAEFVAQEPDAAALESVYLDMVFELLANAKDTSLGREFFARAVPDRALGGRHEGLRRALRKVDGGGAIRSVMGTYFDGLDPYPPGLHERVMQALIEPGQAEHRSGRINGTSQTRRVALVMPKANLLPGFIEAAELGQKPYRLVPPELAQRLERVSDWETWRKIVLSYWRDSSPPAWSDSVARVLYRTQPYVEAMLPLFGAKLQMLFVPQAESERTRELTDLRLRALGVAYPLVWAMEPVIDADRRVARRTRIAASIAAVILLISGTHLGLYGYAEWQWRDGVRVLAEAHEACDRHAAVNRGAAGEGDASGSPRHALPGVEFIELRFARACQSLETSQTVPLLAWFRVSDRPDQVKTICSHAEELVGFREKGVPIGFGIPPDVVHIPEPLLCEVSTHLNSDESGVPVSSFCSDFSWMPGWAVSAVFDGVPAVDKPYTAAQALFDWASLQDTVDFVSGFPGDGREVDPYGALLAITRTVITNDLLKVEVPYSTVQSLFEKSVEWVSGIGVSSDARSSFSKAMAEFGQRVADHLSNAGVPAATVAMVLERSAQDYPMRAIITDARNNHRSFIWEAPGWEAPLSNIDWNRLNLDYGQKVCGPGDVVSILLSGQPN
jgi:hypothetical protein